MIKNKLTKIRVARRALIEWIDRKNFQLRLQKIYRQKSVAHENISKQTTRLHFYTIAFNNPIVIEKQIILMRKNLLGDYLYTVVDNSSDLKVREELSELCKKKRIEYISLPYNDIGNHGGGSASHGAALNWLYRNIITIRKDEYFGFVDHDIFPIDKNNLYELIKGKDFYGLYQNREEKWYLWAGYCFFNTEFAKQHKLDFMPCKGLDTGGSNYNILFKDYDKNKIDFATQKYKHLRAKGVQKPILLEYIDNWMHIFSGSDWKNNKVYDIRMKELEKYIK